jgi:hypothetical protein
LKAVEKWGIGDKGIRENNGRCIMDQNKVHSQQGYIEKPFEH